MLSIFSKKEKENKKRKKEYLIEKSFQFVLVSSIGITYIENLFLIYGQDIRSRYMFNLRERVKKKKKKKQKKQIEF